MLWAVYGVKPLTAPCLKICLFLKYIGSTMGDGEADAEGDIDKDGEILGLALAE